MLILSTKDSNNNIVHVATVIADKENEKNYTYLLENCVKNGEMKRFLSSSGTTIYINGHRGSLAATKKILPHTAIRRCVRHIVTNLSKLGSVSE